MPAAKTIFVTDERRVWMRLRTHTAVFDREPDFARHVNDPSGSVLRILRIWIADPAPGTSALRHYVGSIRRCDCGGWMSHRELYRLFHRATITAKLIGENAAAFRAQLSAFLRDYFNERGPATPSRL
jgi:hypothetical protein